MCCILQFTITCLHIYFCFAERSGLLLFRVQIHNMDSQTTCVQHQTKLSLQLYKQKFSSEINTFLKEDILAFATSFDVTANLDDVKFESVHGTPGVNANFVLVPPLKGMSASKTTKSILQDCGIDVGNTTPIAINPCTATYHKQHDFLMPFYKTNDQLLRHYKRVMNGRDAERKKSYTRGP